MNGSYRKKRRKVGPSKNDEKVGRAKAMERMSSPGNSLSARFPGVTRLVVRLTFVSRQHQLLSEETRTFGPRDACDFTAPCPGNCGVGDFDLGGKITAVITARESV